MTRPGRRVKGTRPGPPSPTAAPVRRSASGTTTEVEDDLTRSDCGEVKEVADAGKEVERLDGDCVKLVRVAEVLG